MSHAHVAGAAADEDLIAQVGDFALYDDFLDSKVTKLDLDLLNDRCMARKMVELGYRDGSVGYTERAFYRAKQINEARRAEARIQHKILSAGRTFEHDAMLRALQQREEANRTGKNCSIIMIRDYNEEGQEISGYIDYAYRLQTEDFEPVFDGKKRLLPNMKDLSFYNWESTRVYYNDSPNYHLIANSLKGLQFLSKRDGKVMFVDTDSSPGENSSRTYVPAEHYTSVIIFDHYNRRRT